MAAGEAGGASFSKPIKWKSRRRLLTPTFHYDILKDFVQVYNKHAATLTGKFDALVGKGYINIARKLNVIRQQLLQDNKTKTADENRNLVFLL